MASDRADLYYLMLQIEEGCVPVWIFSPDPNKEIVVSVKTTGLVDAFTIGHLKVAMRQQGLTKNGCSLAHMLMTHNGVELSNGTPYHALDEPRVVELKHLSDVDLILTGGEPDAETDPRKEALEGQLMNKHITDVEYLEETLADAYQYAKTLRKAPLKHMLDPMTAHLKVKVGRTTLPRS